jgi:O-antigen/teichoic acid export membrane protein
MTRLAPALSERNETALERCDRHLAELLQEVRVAQTGVQVLFGFLLTVPFTVRFGTLGSGHRLMYFATLAVTGAAAMLLIAPSAQHRILFRCGDKEYIVRMANRYAIAGLACVAIAMVGALVFVADVILDKPLAGATGAIAALGALWCWYLQPLRRRRALYRDAPEPRVAADSSATGTCADAAAPMAAAQP